MRTALQLAQPRRKVSASDHAPPGYRLDRWDRRLERGGEVFDRSAQALRKWDVHRGAGLAVCADGPPTVGLVVAMSAPPPIGFIDVTCRVVSVVDDPNCFGFAYGTLPIHPEQGEESFTVEQDEDDEVTFRIAAEAPTRSPWPAAGPATAAGGD